MMISIGNGKPMIKIAMAATDMAATTDILAMAATDMAATTDILVMAAIDMVAIDAGNGMDFLFKIFFGAYF